jgi:hypothetical protein
MPARPLAAALLLSIVLVAVACSSASNTADGSVLSSQCSWAASLNDAGPGACSAERALVTCTDQAGDSCVGLSDDPMTCSGCGSGFTNPVSKCGAARYGVVCGSPSTGGPTAAPPDGCTSAEITPGVIFYCCPCS